jgi:hypothetical protein
LTPRVWEELRGWLGRRPDHPILKAIRAKDPAIAVYDEPGASGQAVFDYYVTLLASRRITLEVAREQFKVEYGREPTPEEASTRVQQFFGSRGLLLAKKPNPARTDEALVYLAVEHALTTGRQSVILTADADIEEQFYKLFWLIDTHYRGMLLADRYVKESVGLRPKGFPKELTSDPRWPFEAEGGVMIDRGSHDLNDLLPEKFSFVAISCWTVDTYFSALIFGAEQEMARLLAVKDRTGGLSTDRLGARNVHVWLAPLPIPEPDRGRAAVVLDRRFDILDSQAKVAALDVLQAFGDFERHSEVVYVERSPIVMPY